MPPGYFILPSLRGKQGQNVINLKKNSKKYYYNDESSGNFIEHISIAVCGVVG